MQLTAKQKEFEVAAGMGRNIFLTGKAGSGKSAVVRYLMDKLTEEGIGYIAVAPTGIAASNIDGATIHSTFNINPFGVQEFETCNWMKDTKRDMFRHVRVIFVDEVSMLRPDILDAMHWTLQKNGLDGLDKRQIIFVGDMKQLQAVLNDNTRTMLYASGYRGEAFHYARIFERLNVQHIELTEIMRQSDPEFIAALNGIRDGEPKIPYLYQFFKQEPRGIILAPHNTTVKRYNDAGLAAQPGKEHKFTARYSGNAKETDFNLEQEIRVKHGCKIMYLVNSENNPLRNGTLGEFREKDGNFFIHVGGVDFKLERVQITKKDYIYSKAEQKLELVEIGSITQYPIKLAYALSIHKSQGLTFDEMTLDIRRACFAPGQLYVGLSRCRTPQGLTIIPPTYKS